MADAPTPIAKHRRYTKRQKATAVIAAEMTNVAAAAEAMGIPKRTLAHWRDDPELAELALKTRADLADEMKVLAQLAARELMVKVANHEIEPRDLVVMLGVAVDKGQLLDGQATSRTEHRELLGDAPDETLDAIDEYLFDIARKKLADAGS